MSPAKSSTNTWTPRAEASATASYPQRVGVSRNGMVSSAHYAASEAGSAVLAEGGNAVDAAVATAFALGVCEPAASGLGGQSFLVIYDPTTRKTVALDGSSRAPNRVEPGDALSRAEQLHGYRASTVPSTPATLGYALETWGSRPLAAVLAPAIELADQGYRLSELQVRLTKRERKHLEAGTAGPLFLKDGHRVPSVGSLFKQPALASTLRRLAKFGIKDFYSGKIAKAIAADMKAHDGLIRLDDLAQVPMPVERRPVSGRFRNLRVHSMSPPGAGQTLLQMLNFASKLPERELDLDSPRGAVALAMLLRRAHTDRRDQPFDPTYYPQLDDKQLLGPDYAQVVAKQIRKRIKAQGETTHLSVIDRDGMVVSLTQSIERVYGSCCATPELGFLYNNYMSAFEYSDMSHPYYLRPNSVPWASVAPSIVFRGRKPWLAIGSPGSERITSALLQVLIRLEHSSPLEAVAAPRLHCSRTGKVSLEAARMRSDLPATLKRHGFEVDIREPWAFYLGCVQMVLHDKGEFIGVADPRRDGAAQGPSVVKQA